MIDVVRGETSGTEENGITAGGDLAWFERNETMDRHMEWGS